MKPWKKSSASSEQALSAFPLDDKSPFYARPVLALLVAFISGVLIGRLAPGNMLGWMVLAAGIIRTTQLLLAGKPAVFSPLLLFAALGYLAISPFIYPEFPPDKEASLYNKQTYILSATVSDTPKKEDYRTTCTLKRITIIPGKDEDTPTHLQGRLRAVFYGEMPRIGSGDRIAVSAKIRPLNNFNNPGGFDYRQHMAYRRTWGSIYVTGKTIEIIPQTSGNLTQLISRFRAKLDSAIGQVSSGDTRAVLSALIIGRKDLVSGSLRDAFSHAGASHLLAISGLHMGIVAAAAFAFFAMVLRRIPIILRHGWVKKGSALLCFLPVIGYGLLSGLAPSTQRSVIMVSVFLCALLFEKEHNPANTLATAAMVILAIVAPALFNLSFQLSFAAVSAIFFGFYFLPGLKTPKGNKGARFGKRLVGFMAVSFFAIVGTMPLIMYYFNHISILGIFSNLVLIPLIGFLAVPIGLTASILYPVYTPLSLTGFGLCGRLVELGIAFIDFLGKISIGTFKTITPSIPEIICIYLLLICLPILWKWKHEPGKKVGTRIIAVIVAATIFLSIGDIAYWIHRRYLSGQVRITILDVGQGNAALVEIPEGETMLIDGGGFSDNATFDVGATIVAPYLWRNKIRTVDTVVLTHPHSDHLNGLLYILKHFSVKKVISTGFPSESAAYENFIGTIEKRQIPHITLDEMERSFDVNGVELRILYPDPRENDLSYRSISANDSSIMLRLKYHGSSMLFPGDVEADTERKVVIRNKENLQSTFLLAPHHGSKSSSTSDFLDAVAPDTVIVSARKIRYGLPAEEVIERYHCRGYSVLRTDIDGAVRILIDESCARVIPTVTEKPLLM